MEKTEKHNLIDWPYEKIPKSETSNQSSKKSAEPDEDKKSLFICDICINEPSEPMATPCGHVFCWQCIYDWLNQPTAAKICPRCHNAISLDKLITLYGAGSSNENNPRKRQSSAAPPPRPQGQRQEAP